MAAYLIYRTDAIEFGLLVTVGAFMVALPVLALLHWGRRREERYFEREGRRPTDRARGPSLLRGVVTAALWIAGGLLFKLVDERDDDHAPEGGWPGVTVLIPAYNEAPVIATSVQAALASDYPELEPRDAAAGHEQTCGHEGPLTAQLRQPVRVIAGYGRRP